MAGGKPAGNPGSARSGWLAESGVPLERTPLTRRFDAPAIPSFTPDSVLRDHRNAAFESVNQVLGMEFQLLQAHFLQLFVHGEVGLGNQLFQPLSVATVFGVQAVNLFAQRSVLNFFHRRLLWVYRTFT